jgi:SAM-dependent methyltransferase
MDPARATHRDVTRREFARQAASFERAGSLFRAGDILEWIGAHVPVTAADVVLDVAGGTGQLARHLARSAAFAVVVDLTAEMLQTGARSAHDAGDRNVVFVEGDATRLPFASEQFDVVVSRFALHHVDDVAAAGREMARVCRPGGAVAIIDLVAQDGEVGVGTTSSSACAIPATRAPSRSQSSLASSPAPACAPAWWPSASRSCPWPRGSISRRRARPSASSCSRPSRPRPRAAQRPAYARAATRRSSS